MALNKNNYGVCYLNTPPKKTIKPSMNVSYLKPETMKKIYGSQIPKPIQLSQPSPKPMFLSMTKYSQSVQDSPQKFKERVDTAANNYIKQKNIQVKKAQDPKVAVKLTGIKKITTSGYAYDNNKGTKQIIYNNRAPMYYTQGGKNSVISHELGHQIDHDNYPKQPNFYDKTISKKRGFFENASMNARLINYKTDNQKRQEIFAMEFRKFQSNPDKYNRQNPKIAKIFMNNLQVSREINRSINYVPIYQ